MREALIRLRKLAAERGDNGSPSARDNLINSFLQELSYSVGNNVISRLPDTMLRHTYVKWVDAVMAGASEQERIDWLAEGVSVMVFDYQQAEDSQLPMNVVQLRR